MMKPEDFLFLASSIVEWGIDLIPHLKSLENAILAGEPMEIPELWISEFFDKDQHRCSVWFHDGRHRMKAAKNLGIEKVPVAIKYYAQREGTGYTDLADAKKQTCFSCSIQPDDKIICNGPIRSQPQVESYEEVEDEHTYIKFRKVYGSIKDITFDFIPFDWSKLPGVHDGTG